MAGLEEAKQYLAQRKTEDWQERRWREVARLPGELRAPGWQLLGYEADGKRPLASYFGYGGLTVQEGGRALEALGATERQRVLAAVWPTLWRQVDAAWELQKGLPYGLYWGRRGFRAPRRPELSLARRTYWLNNLATTVSPYEEDVVWLAQWAGYLPDRGGELGLLFAAAMEQGNSAGEEVYQILAATARGEHETGLMGRHVVRALLTASRAQGWELMEQTLLAAQRQEGLRQVILETVDEAHPQAFRRLVRLIHQENLIRFSSVVRAVDVWLGLGWEAASAAQVRAIVAQLDELLWAEDGLAAALQGDEPTLTYLAHCVTAFADVEQAIAQAAPYLQHADVEQRFVAASFLAQALLPESQAALLPSLQDEDLRVALVALRGATPRNYSPTANVPPDLFEQLEAALPHFPAKARQLEPLVWPWASYQASRHELLQHMISALGERPVRRLLPYYDELDPGERSRVVRLLAERQGEWDEETRELMVGFLGDRSGLVREVAVQALAEMTLRPADAQEMEGYLTRTAGDLRRGVIGLLLRQKDEAALASARRLLAASQTLQRQAGLELLRQMKEDGRREEACRRLLQGHAQGRERLPTAERKLLETLLQGEQEGQTLEDGLGLYDPAERTPVQAPQRVVGRFRRSPFVSDAARQLILSLDDFIHGQRERPVQLPGPRDREELLGNMSYGFPSPLYYAFREQVAQGLQQLPLRELWQQWWQERPATTRDDDGLELLRALAAFAPARSSGWFGSRAGGEPRWVRRILQEMFLDVDRLPLRYRFLLQSVFFWQMAAHSLPGAADFLLDGVEHTLALAEPESYFVKDERYGVLDWRQRGEWLRWLELARTHQSLQPQEWSEAQHVRLWQLLHWLDEPRPGFPRRRPRLDELMRAYQAGGATEADLLDQLIGPRTASSLYFYGSGFDDLRLASGLRPDTRQSQYAGDPALQELVERCRQRIVTIESQRGDLTTAASGPALALRYAGGARPLVRLLRALGRQPFLRGWSYDSSSKKAVLSHLIRATSPRPEDSSQELARLLQAAGIGEKRLIETAMYAPQWAELLQEVVGWPELAEAIWWFHAHTKDTNWQVDQEIRALWNAQVGERTPLTGEELLEGAVDVAWFQRVYSAMGEARWQTLDRAAKYASSSGGHKRAQLFAQAMAGAVDETALLQRIRQKRHQDSVRALGLLPLSEGAAREEALMGRYLFIQEFVRGSRKFGSQRQASEGLAARIGLENLARTAGYPDPLQLQWALEARTAGDLARGPVAATSGEVMVTLSVDQLGEAHIDVEKNGRRLKSVPARVKKEEAVAALLARKQELAQQASRARRSLEQAMCRGDRFTPAQLQALLGHPVLRPMLAQLLFVPATDGLAGGGEGLLAGPAGYLVQEGQALEEVDGRVAALPAGVSLRIAHPHDLLQRGDWHLWQQECFRRERIQPFKQIFRELYPLTEAEKAEGTFSRRYDGQQVNPRQALALLSSRGWVVHPEEGMRRTFHDERILAWLGSAGNLFTPADVEGLTLERVTFTRRGAWQPLPLLEVPPRLFSEVMRDLDLVVSVAHMGGVDPEATASTVEMRASLLRESCELLGLENVRLSRQHALISGALNDYSVHLGSGTVHQQPGGAVCIVPVHSQHRGRLFLPFADDDPKTAEVLSKVLLLARDEQIKDPTILEQITRVG